jgi:hypothetical protein
MILDQRHMYDLPGKQRSVKDVVAYWREFADKNMATHGTRFAQRPDAKAFRKSQKQLVAYLNHSRWVADCPMPDCNGGIALWQDNPEACCLDCGTIFTNIKWPRETEMAKVLVAAVSVDEPARNYDPRRQTAAEAVERMKGLT